MCFQPKIRIKKLYSTSWQSFKFFCEPKIIFKHPFKVLMMSNLCLPNLLVSAGFTFASLLVDLWCDHFLQSVTFLPHQLPTFVSSSLTPPSASIFPSLSSPLSLSPTPPLLHLPLVSPGVTLWLSSLDAEGSVCGLTSWHPGSQASPPKRTLTFQLKWEWEMWSLYQRQCEARDTPKERGETSTKRLPFWHQDLALPNSL